jgi:hypothetical protein
MRYGNSVKWSTQGMGRGDLRCSMLGNYVIVWHILFMVNLCNDSLNYDVSR